MLINLLLLLVGSAGSLVLFYGLGENWLDVSTTKNASLFNLPEALDLNIQTSLNSLGEPLWSSFTLEIFRVVVFTVCFLTLLALIGEWGEKRILAFLVMMEVLLVFLATLLVLIGSSAGFNISAHYNAALCILAAGGSDTALALALFMTYFKASGETTLK
jgi:hypothetical protein